MKLIHRIQERCHLQISLASTTSWMVIYGKWLTTHKLSPRATMDIWTIMKEHSKCVLKPLQQHVLNYMAQRCQRMPLFSLMRKKEMWGMLWPTDTLMTAWITHAVISSNAQEISVNTAAVSMKNFTTEMCLGEMTTEHRYTAGRNEDSLIDKQRKGDAIF